MSNLGALRDEKHEHDELRQEQLTELENQFEFKVCLNVSLFVSLLVCLFLCQSVALFVSLCVYLFI